ncbi:MAG: hypothetical protein AAF624_18480 [Bacteroidota bacterium]
MTAQSFRPVALIAAMLFAPAALAQPLAQATLPFDDASMLPLLVTTAPTAALLDRTDGVLATLWTNPTAAAAQTYDPERALGDFSRLALAMTAEAGRYVSHETVGAATATLGRTYTYARVQFTDAEVTMRLTWKDSQLVTVTRGPIPAATKMLARR